MTRYLFAYWDIKCFFVRDLKEQSDLHFFIFVGRAFHTSGPLCRIDLCASSIFGLLRWKSCECRVGYLCTLALCWKKIKNTSGNSWRLNFCMNKAVWWVCISYVVKVFNRWNNGFVFERYPELVQIRMAFFEGVILDLLLFCQSYPKQCCSNLYAVELKYCRA